MSEKTNKFESARSAQIGVELMESYLVVPNCCESLLFSFQRYEGSGTVFPQTIFWVKDFIIFTRFWAHVARVMYIINAY